MLQRTLLLLMLALPLAAMSGILSGPPQSITEGPTAKPAVAVAGHAVRPEFLAIWVNAANGNVPAKLLSRLFARKRLIAEQVEIAEFSPLDTFPTGTDPAVSFNQDRNEYLVVYPRSETGLFAARIADSGQVVASDIPIQLERHVRQIRIAELGANSLILWVGSHGINGRLFSPRLETRLGPLNAYSDSVGAFPGITTSPDQNPPSFFVFQKPNLSNPTGTDLFAQSLDRNGNPIGAAKTLLTSAGFGSLAFFDANARGALAFVRSRVSGFPRVFVSRVRPSVIGRPILLSRRGQFPQLLATARRGESLAVWQHPVTGMIYAKLLNRSLRPASQVARVGKSATAAIPAVAVSSDRDTAAIVWTANPPGTLQSSVESQILDVSGIATDLRLRVVPTFDATSISAPSSDTSSSSSSSSTNLGKTNLNYQVIIQNPSAVAATGLKLSLSIGDLSVEKIHSSAGASCNKRGCQLPELASGAEFRLFIRGTIDCGPVGLAKGGSYTQIFDARASWTNAPKPSKRATASAKTRVSC